jgi:hypothetical protein
MARDEPDEGVEERRRADRPEPAAEPPREPDLREQLHGPAGSQPHRCPVAVDEPGALVPHGLRHRREQPGDLGVGERQQRELILPVEPGDDPRRPTAEASAVVVEQDGALQGRHVRPKPPRRNG